MWIREVELVLCARNRHIKQTPLFFERIAGIKRATAWKHSVRQPDDEDGIKLESFRLMHRGKIDRLFIGRLIRGCFRINIADQRQLGKEFVYVFELTCKRRELVQILTTQFVICEIDFRVVVVNRFHNRRDHLRRRIWLSGRCDFIDCMRELFPHFS